jgi:hypothetical protein
MMSYAMKQRIAHINTKKMNGSDKSKLFNNQMFRKFIINRNNNNKKLGDSIKNEILSQNLINFSKSKIDTNNKMCSYALKINGIINDLNDVVENSSPIINTPEHPFTKMNIGRHLMVGTSIQPYVYETEPIIEIDADNIVYGIWTDRIDITGFLDNNITEIYNLIINIF